MNKILTSIMLLFFLMTITSCSKDIIEANQDFIGIWDGEFTTLEIRANGKGIYNNIDGNIEFQIKGNVTIEEDEIIISFLGITKTAIINQRPTTDANGIYMILDDEILYKQ
jgi:hypothetical protein